MSSIFVGREITISAVSGKRKQIFSFSDWQRRLRFSPQKSEERLSGEKDFSSSSSSGCLWQVVVVWRVSDIWRLLLLLLSTVDSLPEVRKNKEKKGRKPSQASSNITGPLPFFAKNRRLPPPSSHTPFPPLKTQRKKQGLPPPLYIFLQPRSPFCKEGESKKKGKASPPPLYVYKQSFQSILSLISKAGKNDQIFPFPSLWTTPRFFLRGSREGKGRTRPISYSREEEEGEEQNNS